MVVWWDNGLVVVLMQERDGDRVGVGVFFL